MYEILLLLACAGEWSAPVNGLQARLCPMVKGNFNGTPIITTYLELRNVSDHANPLELPLDAPDIQLKFTVTDGAGKSVAAAGGPFRELRADQGVLRIPFDSQMRINIAHRGAGVPKDHAAHLDLGADLAIDGLAAAPAVWDFKCGDTGSYYLHASLTVRKGGPERWAGTLEIPKVKLPTLAAAAAGSTVDKDKDVFAAQRIEEALGKLAKGDGDWKRFSVTYDDLHPLHGGLTLTIDGAGKVTQKAVRQKVGEVKDVSASDLKKLVELLQKHQAWEQKEAERKPRPDESKARLMIRYGEDSVTVWEWYNDLRKNNRLLEIREAMKKAPWKANPEK